MKQRQGLFLGQRLSIPTLAKSSDVPWTSVAKTFTTSDRGSTSRRSRMSIATEYASSPVAQPAIQTRDSSPSGSLDSTTPPPEPHDWGGQLSAVQPWKKLQFPRSDSGFRYNLPSQTVDNELFADKG